MRAATSVCDLSPSKITAFGLNQARQLSLAPTIADNH
jgi:hypothetical protein